MRTMVCFRTARGRFALSIESTLSVRTIEGLVELPAPRADIVGVLPGDPPVSVLAPLGTGGDRVLIVSSNDTRFGLQVLEVLGVQRFADDQVGPPPNGQEGGLIVGTIHIGDELTLVADAAALAAYL